MNLGGHHKRLTIFVGESDRHGHTPLATEIVQRAHRAGLAGASVFRGIEGYVEVVTYVGRPDRGR